MPPSRQEYRLVLALVAFAIASCSTKITTSAFSVEITGARQQRRDAVILPEFWQLYNAEPDMDDTPASVDEITFESEAQKKEAVGNLVADDEWEGLSLELAEAVRVAVMEDLKRNARDFLGKDDYQIGDLSKEIDRRVKQEVAQLRNKDQYELGDLVRAMDDLSKQYTEQLTGKPYETGDLSRELDARIKAAVANFCGKDEYEFGDLTREVGRRVQVRVQEFTGKPYEFGDVSREIEKRRQTWVQDVLGAEAAANYQFGDITKKMLSNLTGRDDYQFGDLTKKLVGNLFGGKNPKSDKDQ